MANHFHKVAWLLVVSCVALVPFQARAGFTNAGFESNNFTSWTVGSWNFGTTLSPFPPTSVSGLGLTSTASNGMTSIVTAGTDGNTNNNLSYPIYGSYAAVVNFGETTHTATMLTSDVEPNDNKVHIRFAIAPVLENPSHNANQQPFFVVEVKDITKGSTLYFQYNYGGQAGVPWLSGASGFQYTKWQSIDISPGAGSLDVGDSVSLQMTLTVTDAAVNIASAPASGSQYPVEANVSGAWSAEDSVALVPVTPGIRVEDSGDAYAEHADLSPISDASPAQPGETVIIYLTGMGATDVYVASGIASPSDPLAHPIAMPTVLVNGAAAPIAFVGLTPGLVGTYQVNFQLPKGLPNGRVKVAASQMGVTTNTVTIPVVGQ